jgi:hypothetical protein
LKQGHVDTRQNRLKPVKEVPEEEASEQVSTYNYQITSI